MPMSSATTVEEYMNELSPEVFEKLSAVRAIILDAVPAEAEECIYYQMPAVKLNGPLVGFCAFKKHYSFFPMNGHTVDLFTEELKGYKTSTGTIQLPYDKPIPEKLIRDIIAHRIEENLSKPIKKKKTTSK